MLVGARQAAEMFVDLVRRCKKQKTKNIYIYIYNVGRSRHTHIPIVVDEWWLEVKKICIYVLELW